MPLCCGKPFSSRIMLCRLASLRYGKRPRMFRLK